MLSQLPSRRFNVLITTWEHIMQDEKDGGVLRDIPWDTVIVDEAHRLKNRDSKTFKSLKDFKAMRGRDADSQAHCVLMTGTPLQNNTEELWCLLHFLDEDSYYDIDDFLERYGPARSPEP